MRKHVLLIVGALLLLLMAVPAFGSQSDKAVFKTLWSLSAEVAEAYAGGAELPDGYRRPRPFMPIKITTYPGVECLLPSQVKEEGAMLVRFAWDFDSDGVIDWESRKQEPAVHTFTKVGSQIATFFAFDIYGKYGRAEVPVQVLEGSGQPKIEPNLVELSLTDLDKRRPELSDQTVPLPAKSYFLLLADWDDWLWAPLTEAYHRLVDSFAYADEDIIVLAGGDLDLTNYYESCLEDTVIIDYRYTASGVSSAFNYLLANMTEDDDLHILNMTHGAGFFDSSIIVYDEGWTDHRPFELEYGRVFTETPDGDLYVTEQDFKVATPLWWNWGELANSVGMNKWTGHWRSYDWGEVIYREIHVATFSGMKFVGTSKSRDDDIFIETIKQYVKGDVDHKGVVNYQRGGEVWDFDGDGIPPIRIENGEYVYDEDDWGVTELLIDPEEDAYAYYLPFGYFGNIGSILPIDDGFDGIPEICYECVHGEVTIDGRDEDNDGVIDWLDVNKDGDLLDSVGVDEISFNAYDNTVAAFLDNLQYRYVTAILYNCFSGGFINDLSRPNVLIAASTTEGTVAWDSHQFAATMFKALTGGFGDPGGFAPAADSVVTFLEAFNYIQNIGLDDGRVRLDDDGDRVGHIYPLPNGGDGALAAELYWGRLTQPLPAATPVAISPVQDEQLYAYTVTFTWSDTADADYYEVQWGNATFTTGGSGITTDTFFTTPQLTPLPWLDMTWRVRAYKQGSFVSPWTDPISFDVRVDYTCCVGMRGNADGDPNDDVNWDDLGYLADYLYNGGPLPPCLPEGNVDGSEWETPDVADLAYLQAYLLGTGPPPVECLTYLCGDVNNDGVINVLDVLYLSDYLNYGGPAPDPLEAADVDCNGVVDEDDLNRMVEYLYNFGPAPCDCD